MNEISSIRQFGSLLTDLMEGADSSLELYFLRNMKMLLCSAAGTSGNGIKRVWGKILPEHLHRGLFIRGSSHVHVSLMLARFLKPIRPLLC